MNQLSKRIISGTMALAMVGAAAPVSSFLGIKTAITASAERDEHFDETIKFSELDRSDRYEDCAIQNDTDKTVYLFLLWGTLYADQTGESSFYQGASKKVALAPGETTSDDFKFDMWAGYYNQAGENIFWSCDEATNTLTYSGTGVFTGRSWDFTPPSDKKIIIGEGITEIKGIINSSIFLEEIEFPSTLERIELSSGDSLLDTSSLTTVTFPASLKYLGNGGYLFYGLTNLASVYFEGDCPEIDQNFSLAVQNTGDNVQGGTIFYYPENNDTWKGIETKQPKYTWKSYKPTPKINKVPVTALGSNVTINDSLNMNFFMDIPEGLKDTAKIMASVNGGEAKELTPVLVDGTTYKVTVENISAKDAAEPIKFYAVDKTDNTKLLSKEFETSIEDYLVSVYEAADEEDNNYPTSTKSFVLSILNYCDTAEKYFNLSTTTDFTLSKIDNFADKYALIAKTSSEVLDADNIKNAKTTPDALTNAEKYRYWGSTLLLKSKLALRQYYKAENGADTTGFDGCKSDIELYYFEETNISPTMLDTDINGYSILSYIKQVLSDDSSDASLKNVCTALYNYSEWAKQYQLDLKDDDET